MCDTVCVYCCASSCCVLGYAPDLGCYGEEQPERLLPFPCSTGRRTTTPCPPKTRRQWLLPPINVQQSPRLHTPLPRDGLGPVMSLARRSERTGLSWMGSTTPSLLWCMTRSGVLALTWCVIVCVYYGDSELACQCAAFARSVDDEGAWGLLSSLFFYEICVCSSFFFCLWTGHCQWSCHAGSA